MGACTHFSARAHFGGIARHGVSPQWLSGASRRPFFCAPGRAHVLGGESPRHTRQGEVLAERQGCRGRLRIRRKLKAKRWPDEQEADKRRRRGVSRQISVKPDTCTERDDVDPTGISVKVRAP